MFTGIIKEVGIISNVSTKNNKRIIRIRCNTILENTKIGQSICTNGICLTVCKIDDFSFTAETMLETISKTTTNLWKKGDKVNLETAMQITDRLDGHIVQGHVDTISKILNINKTQQNLTIEISLPSNFASLVVLHGSVAINGVSLTVSHLTNYSFCVSIISHTTQITTINMLKNNDLVNIEFDILGKYILRKQNYENNKLTENRLRKLGY